MKCDLVLEGGGVKGIALVGTVAALRDRGYEFGRIAGTSAGTSRTSSTSAGTPRCCASWTASTGPTTFVATAPWVRFEA